MDDVEFLAMFSDIFQGIGLVELEGIVPLRFYVHPHDLESCAAIAHRGTAGTTEKVKKSHFLSSMAWM